MDLPITPPQKPNQKPTTYAHSLQTMERSRRNSSYSIDTGTIHSVEMDFGDV